MKKIIFILTLLSFAAGLFFLKSVLPSNERINETAFLPLSSETKALFNDEDPKEIIKIFFNLVGNGKVDEALQLFQAKIIPDKETKNDWFKQFSILKSITVNSITKLNSDEEVYRVQLTIDDISPTATGAAIPNYGWNVGENVRWITMEKENNLWKISQIATGP